MSLTQDVFEGTKGLKTVITLPTDSKPRPNEYFKQLQSSIHWINGVREQRCRTNK